MPDNRSFYHALKIREDICYGCSHCISVCPTQALRISGGKAKLLPNRCVDCGECYRACPVSAIVIEHDDFNKIFDYTYRVALIPNVFPGQFPESISLQKIYSALHTLGFTHVYPVESSADILAETLLGYAKQNDREKPLISSFCPAIVRLIQVRFPALVDNIVLLKPPLDISAIYVRNELTKLGAAEKEIGIFYVTPCAAKIAAIKDPVGEADSPIAGSINMDQLFNKVYSIIKQGSFAPDQAEVDVPVLSPGSVCWSLTNGEAVHAEGRSLAIDELRNVIEFLEKLEDDNVPDVDFLELRACDESCAGGVLISGNRFLTVERLRNQARQAETAGNFTTATEGFRPIETEKEFLQSRMPIGEVSPRPMMHLDDNISVAMRKMEKMNKIIQLLPMVDCTLCGAPDCHTFARDIVHGTAEIKQCVFIQKILEQRGEMTLEESARQYRKIWGNTKINRYRDLKGYTQNEN